MKLVHDPVVGNLDDGTMISEQQPVSFLEGVFLRAVRNKQPFHRNNQHSMGLGLEVGVVFCGHTQSDAVDDDGSQFDNKDQNSYKVILLPY